MNWLALFAFHRVFLTLQEPVMFHSLIMSLESLKDSIASYVEQQPCIGPNRQETMQNKGVCKIISKWTNSVYTSPLRSTIGARASAIILRNPGKIHC